MTSWLSFPCKAAESNDASGVEAALEGGAVVDGADTAGFTALMKASTKGLIPALRSLSHLYCSSLSTLVQASMKGRGFIVQTLLAAGAHVNLQVDQYCSTLLLACLCCC